MSTRPLEWVKYHMAKMGHLLATRLGLDLSAHGAASILFHEYLITGGPLPDDDNELAALSCLTKASPFQRAGITRTPNGTGMICVGRAGCLLSGADPR